MNIQLDLKENALLPNRKYLFTYPDSFRIWINEYPRASEYIRKNFDYFIKHYLNTKFGIDMRDTNFKTAHLRKVLIDQEKMNFRLQNESNKH